MALWDPNPLRKKVEDYRSVVSALLSLRKAAFLYSHPKMGGRKRL